MKNWNVLIVSYEKYDMMIYMFYRNTSEFEFLLKQQVSYKSKDHIFECWKNFYYVTSSSYSYNVRKNLYVL